MKIRTPKIAAKFKDLKMLIRRVGQRQYNKIITKFEELAHEMESRSKDFE